MSSLLALPPELLSTIIDACDRPDLVNLRLVSKYLCALSTHRFGTECLSDLSFILSAHSLQGLVQLTAHPLSRYVQRIFFGTHLLVEQNHLGQDSISVPEEYKSIAKTTTAFLESGSHVKLLTQAFGNLKARGQAVTLGLCDDLVQQDEATWSLSRKMYGFDQLYGAAVPSTDVWTADPGEVLNGILAAADAAARPVKKLHLHLSHNRSFPIHWEGAIFGDFLLGSPGGFEAGVELLVQASHPVFVTSQLRVETDARRLEFRALVPACEPVDWLRHPRALFVGLERYGIVEFDQPAPAFREINLVLCAMSCDSLMDFLRERADSLRVLHLDAVDLDFYDDDDEANPLTLLTLLKDELRLEFLSIHRVRNIGDESRLVGGLDNTWDGREAVQAGLHYYIEKEEDGEHSVDGEWSDEDDWISMHHSSDDEVDPEDPEDAEPGVEGANE